MKWDTYDVLLKRNTHIFNSHIQFFHEQTGLRLVPNNFNTIV